MLVTTCQTTPPVSHQHLQSSLASNPRSAPSGRLQSDCSLCTGGLRLTNPTQAFNPGLKAPSIRFSRPKQGRCECAFKEVLMSPQCECDAVYSDILRLPSRCHDVLGSSVPIFNSVCLRIASRRRISLFALYALHGVCKCGPFPVCILQGRKQMCAITCVQPRR